MTQITIDVPERLAPRLEPVQPYIIEFVEMGLHQFDLGDNPLFEELVNFLATHPSSDEILDLQVSPEVEARIEELLQKNRSTQLSEAEALELEIYNKLDLFFTLVKARTSLKTPHR
jgi:hypothetical protein